MFHVEQWQLVYLMVAHFVYLMVAHFVYLMVAHFVYLSAKVAYIVKVSVISD